MLWASVEEGLWMQSPPRGMGGSTRSMGSSDAVELAMGRERFYKNETKMTFTVQRLELSRRRMKHFRLGIKSTMKYQASQYSAMQAA